MYEYYLLSYGGYLLTLIAFLITIAAEIFIKFTYNKYNKIQSHNKLSGFEVAKKILDNAGLDKIHIIETKGVLSDHFDPTKNVIRLSRSVFHENSIAATSIAAHECGHALQHKDGYIFIKFRSFLIPFVSFCSKFGYFAILIGLIFGYLKLAWAGIGLLLVILLFQLVTLPVEINASKRAATQLQKLNILEARELNDSKKILLAAAFTYIASLAATVLQILRLIIITRGRDD